MTDPDAALVLECRAGNREAFSRLLKRYERPIFNAAYRILNHREDATDVTQTTFMRAYEHFDHFDPAQRFFSWIYRIAVNEALDLARGRHNGDVGVEELTSARAGPDEAAATGQVDAQLQAALMSLRLEYRTVIVLKHLQDFSYEEIGAVLECPIKTVKSRLFTARHALRDLLVARGYL